MIWSAYHEHETKKTSESPRIMYDVRPPTLILFSLKSLLTHQLKSVLTYKLGSLTFQSGSDDSKGLWDLQ